MAYEELIPGADAQAMAEREANERAKAAGEPLRFPNPWDVWDPTKVPEGSSDEEIQQSVREFRKRCRMPLKRHTL